MQNKKAWLALLSICIIWGTTYLFLRVGVQQMAPFYFSAIRQTIAGIILLMIVWYFLRPAMPPVKTILKQSLAGFLMITLGNGLVAYGEVTIPSSMAAVICSSMPVWVAMINVVNPGSHKLTWIGYFSILLGIGGIIWLFSDSLSQFGNRQFMFGAFATLFATLTWIAGSYVIRGGSRTGNPFLLAGIQLFSGGIGLFILSFIFENNHMVRLDSSGWFALVYLIVIGSIIAMAAYSYALRSLPMTVVSIYAYINPVVAIILGWIFMNEKMTLQTLLACTVIIAGVVILNLPFSRKLSVSLATGKN